MKWVFFLLIAFDFLAMIATLLPLWRMAPWVRRPGIGRVFFFALLSLKVWVALVLGWFTLIIAAPGLPLRGIRDWVYIGLVGYIGLQAIAVSVALWRWRRRGRVVRLGGIPDLEDEAERRRKAAIRDAERGGYDKD